MSSRRPLLRSSSGSGRYGSFEGDIVAAHGGRADTRGYQYSMRTETSYYRQLQIKPSRSTLCSVMAQLAVETQPSFETTLKSKAVSESCNVKFTCVLSGHPKPEVIWYKDDIEMDRYCGLPKYEIICNGKTHTLQIYNCTLEDAAIYQASARNSKGIVSCSGLLEVGAMDEFKIHQRFFSKLKQKADSKRKDLENSRSRAGESAPTAAAVAEQPRVPSPVRKPRLVRCPSEPGPAPPPRPQLQRPAREDKPVEKPVERPSVAATTPVANGFAAHQEPVKEKGKPTFLYFGNKVEIISTRPATSRDSPTNKALKINKAGNPEPAGGSAAGSGPSVSGKEKEAGEEEMSLARYLTEFSKSEPSGPLQNGAPTEEAAKLGPVTADQGARGRETAKNRGVSIPAVRASAETLGQKGPESPSTLASMFFSLRDMLFRTKNKNEDPASASGVLANGVDPAHECSARAEGRGAPQVRQREASGKSETPRPEPAKVALPSVRVQAKDPLSSKTQPPELLRNHTPGRSSGLEGPSPVTVRSKALPAVIGGGKLTVPPLSLHEPVGIQLPASDRSRSPETPPTPQPPSETEVTVDRTQMNGKKAPSSQDLSTSQRQQEMQPPPASAGHVKAAAADVHILHNLVHSASGAPTLNMQLPGNVLDKIKKKSPIGPGTAGLHKMAGPENASGHPARLAVKPGQAEPPADTVVVKGGGVGVGAGEIQAGKSRDNYVPYVQEPAERGGSKTWVGACPGNKTKMLAGKGTTEMPTVAETQAKSERKEIAKHVTQINEVPRLLWAQAEKAKSSMIVQAKLLEGPQPEKVLQNVPEALGNVQKDGVTNAMRTSEPKPELVRFQLRVPQVLERTCSKTVMKSQVENTIKPTTLLADNTPTTPVKEQSNLPKEETAEDSTFVMAESNGKTILVAPIQKITERKKSLSQLKEIQTGAPQDQEVKSGREMATANSCGQHSTGKATDSAPAIHDSIEGNSGLNKTNADHQLHSVKPSITVWAPPKVPTFVVPPISITDTDGALPENTQPSKEVEELDSIATLLEEVMNDLESCVILSAVGKNENNPTPCCVEEATPTNDSDTPLGITTPEPGVKETPSSVSESPLEKVLPCVDVIDTQQDKEEQQKQPHLASDTFSNQHGKDKSGLCKSPLHSPTTQRRDPARNTPDIEASGLLAVPVIRVDRAPLVEKYSREGIVRDALPPPVPSCESSPRLTKRDSLTPIPSATPEELALGARRKIFIPKSKTEEAELPPALTDAPAKTEDVPKRRMPSQEQEAPGLSPSLTRRPSLLQLPAGQQTPPFPRRSPLLARKKTTPEVPKCPEETVKEPDAVKTEPKLAEKNKPDPLKAPQVIRKIRAEAFPDNVGHLKLCCQFFNVVSDSTITWCRDEAEIVEVNRSAGDESQVALAIVQVSSMDCGVYSCSIKNEYGTDSADFFLSAAILSGFVLRADLEVGQEIEMTPLLFTKGLADSGHWGNRFFGRIMITESHVGDGWTRKACRAKVIYGLEPAFESGSTCVLKVRNPISYGKKDENNLVERNLEITQQECKVQNMIREYCKVFSAEARVAGNFGPVLEVIPLYLMYQPANTIPYTTAEADLKGVFLKHCLMDATGRLITRTGSEVEQMCCTFQHWIHQWTNGNLLLTQLEGVDGKITNVGVSTKLKGYQGLSDKATPKVFEQFVMQHQCNDYCSLLGLRSLKVMESLAQPTKAKGSRSPMLNRRGSPSPQLLRRGGTSPQMLRKGGTSPQTPRKVSSSPRLTRRSTETGDGKSTMTNKTVEVPKVASTS